MKNRARGNSKHIDNKHRQQTEEPATIRLHACPCGKVNEKNKRKKKIDFSKDESKKCSHERKCSKEE